MHDHEKALAILSIKGN